MHGIPIAPIHFAFIFHSLKRKKCREIHNRWHYTNITSWTGSGEQGVRGVLVRTVWIFLANACGLSVCLRRSDLAEARVLGWGAELTEW